MNSNINKKKINLFTNQKFNKYVFISILSLLFFFIFIMNLLKEISFTVLFKTYQKNIIIN